MSVSAGKGSRPDLGIVDYTLAKRALLRDARRGLLSRPDICDAHPELMRAAKNIGQETARPCPVCDEFSLRLLAYVYADDLKKNNGRVWSIDAAMKLAAQPTSLAILDDAIVEYETCAWQRDTLHELTAAIGERQALKLNKAQAPIRVAVPGRTVGPPLFESLEQLGRERTIDRLRAAAALVRTGAAG